MASQNSPEPAKTHQGQSELIWVSKRPTRDSQDTRRPSRTHHGPRLSRVNQHSLGPFRVHHEYEQEPISASFTKVSQHAVICFLVLSWPPYITALVTQIPVLPSFPVIRHLMGRYKNLNVTVAVWVLMTEWSRECCCILLCSRYCLCGFVYHC